MRRTRIRSTLVPLALCLAAAAPVLAGFAGTDVFLPSVGSRAGVPPSVWYTTVWLYNPGPSPANVTFYLLERDRANVAPLHVEDTVAPGETWRYDDAVQSLFGRSVFGAIRVTSNEPVIVSSRVYSQEGAALDESVGQFFAGVPAAFALGAGDSTEILGGWQTQPASASTFRFNFGFVETTGTGTCTVTVTVKDRTGASLGSRTYTVRAWEQLQRALKDEFPAVSDDNVRVTVEVGGSSTGRVIAFGSLAANGSQDASTMEMRYADAASSGAVVHDGTLAGDGSVASPLGLADDAVTVPKLATSNTPGGPATTVLGSDGGSLFWTEIKSLSGLEPGGITFGDPGGALAQDTKGLFWDLAGHRLGLGTTAPSQQLELTGNLALPPTTSSAGQIRMGGNLLLHAFGSDNFFVGPGAGNLSPGGAAYNTAVGGLALSGLYGSLSNTAVGYAALAGNPGNSNTAVGAHALTGSQGWGNTAVGNSALTAASTGVRNTGIGSRALESNTAGNGNTALGFRPLDANIEGSENVAVGDSALFSSVTADGNTAVGWFALYSAAGGGNTGVGRQALYDLATGTGNIAVGDLAGSGLSWGTANVYVGAPAGTSSESGTIRIGAPGRQSATYIQGIDGAPVAGGAPVYVMSDGRLGTSVPSSRRFKTDVETLDGLGERAAALRPVRFRYRPEIDPSGAWQLGLIAEEVAEAVPEMVELGPDGEPRGVRYDLLSIVLLAELQQQRQANARQAGELAALQQRLAELAARLDAMDQGRELDRDAPGGVADQPVRPQ